MADKLPKDLSQKWWHDNKPATLKSTGFGEALKNWDAAQTKFDNIKQPCVKDFDNLFAVCEKLLNVRDKAEKMCLPKIHDGAKKALKAYPPLILNSSKQYTTKRSSYDNAVIQLTQTIKDAAVEMKKVETALKTIEKNMDGLEKLAAILKKTPDPVKKQQALKLAADFKKKAEVQQKLIDDAGRDLDKATKSAGVDLADVDNIKGMMVPFNKAGGALDEVLSKHDEVVRLLG